MARLRLLALGLGLGLALLSLPDAGCASSGKSGAAKSGPSDSGSRVLTAVVTEREYDAPGSTGGGGYGGSGSYYLSFEAQDGDKTVHYRFPVTRQQYFRNLEGTRVRITLLGDELRDIRPSQD